ncbi:MAG TPA: excalibur calcium-binding domain-containing protein [Devosia sp.]|nr:excalibur calcium-binding domain-containing protein [Devosia sp.]
MALFILWSGAASAAPSSRVVLGETGLLPLAVRTAQSWSCQPRKTCGKIRSCDEAVWYLYNCNWGSRLDGDSDGAPCESLCGSNN